MMPWVSQKLSRERLMVIGVLFLMNLIMIFARSIYLQRIPAWIYVLDSSLLGVGIVFAVIETRRYKKREENSQEPS
jgi:heme O synthase-like polyprenyltransferase